MGKGRPRKQGERYPGGKLKEPPKLEYLREISPTEVRRIGDHAATVAGDRRLGGEVGRLLLIRQLSTMEAAAAWRIAEIYGRFEHFSGRCRSTRSPAYEMGVRSTGDTKDAGEAERTAFGAWNDLQAFIDVKWPMRPFVSKKFPERTKERGGGSPVRNMIETLCVDDRCIGPAALFEMRAILYRLAVEHFEIVKAAKKEKRVDPVSANVRAQLRTSDFGRDLQVLFETAIEDAAAGLAGAATDASERISEVRDFFVALKDREKFSDDKKRARSNTPRSD